jgi:hypothetical protein
MEMAALIIFNCRLLLCTKVVVRLRLSEGLRTNRDVHSHLGFSQVEAGRKLRPGNRLKRFPFLPTLRSAGLKPGVNERKLDPDFCAKTADCQSAMLRETTDEDSFFSAPLATSPARHTMSLTKHASVLVDCGMFQGGEKRKSKEPQ